MKRLTRSAPSGNFEQWLHIEFEGGLFRGRRRLFGTATILNVTSSSWEQTRKARSPLLRHSAANS